MLKTGLWSIPAFLFALLPLGADPVPGETPASPPAAVAPAPAAAAPSPAPVPAAFSPAPAAAASIPAAGETPADEPNRPQRIIPGEADPRFRSPPLRAELRPLTIPGLEQALTQSYIRRYSAPGGLAWLQSVMRQGGPYLAFIRREIEERNLPPELLYLPVIESGFLSTGTSRSGARGIWQFMRNSIAPFDMSVTEWMDERLDFWKSTQAALRKLEENYRFLGDWPLALAAYNAGYGGITRITRQSGIGDYWTLSEKKLLKTETIHYVPKLLAVAHILSNPRYYGLDLPWPEDPRWTRVKVGKMIDLDILAREAGLDAGELKRFNRELLYNVTPPDPEYQLKVRDIHAGAVAEVLERTDLTLINYYLYTIKYGDTLSALARHYGVSVEQISAANSGLKARYLKIGERIRIPALITTDPYRPQNRAG
ncbi:MAG: transglycosylase SLT domain-containing protein, partial [Spirochaetaceae bacterium]|nr:transglycosylase SLT domain-containing protein [Spirochaetaceae bacterium]